MRPIAGNDQESGGVALPAACPRCGADESAGLWRTLYLDYRRCLFCGCIWVRRLHEVSAA